MILPKENDWRLESPPELWENDQLWLWSEKGEWHHSSLSWFHLLNPIDSGSQNCQNKQLTTCRGCRFFSLLADPLICKSGFEVVCLGYHHFMLKNATLGCETTESWCGWSHQPSTLEITRHSCCLSSILILWVFLHSKIVLRDQVLSKGEFVWQRALNQVKLSPA